MRDGVFPTLFVLSYVGTIGDTGTVGGGSGEGDIAIVATIGDIVDSGEDDVAIDIGAIGVVTTTSTTVVALATTGHLL